MTKPTRREFAMEMTHCLAEGGLCVDRFFPVPGAGVEKNCSNCMHAMVAKRKKELKRGVKK